MVPVKTSKGMSMSDIIANRRFGRRFRSKFSDVTAF